MRLTRRELLAAATAGAGLTAAGCALQAADDRVRTPPSGLAPGRGGEAGEVTGPFSWRRAEGSTIRVLLVDHTYSRALRDHLAAFTATTGISVRTTVLPEAEYFDEVTRQLVSGLPDVDVFMTGAYMVWQYAPPGWMEDLDPWLADASTTAPEYEPGDLLPNLLDALRWDSTLGHPVGTGPLWALPMGWESNALAYRADVLERLGLRPPETFAELEEVSRATAAHMARGVDGGYGLAVRGTRSWATIHAGLMTQLTREGGHDFVTRDGHLAPAIDSPVSVGFHRRWSAMVREAGSPRWREQTYQDCAADLGGGRAALVYDATSGTLPVDVPGASEMAGRIAWSPGPAGPGGDLSSNLWVWSLAISSRSQRKLAAWLFLQWATGREHVLWSAMRHCVDPVRRSVQDDAVYRQSLSRHRGYLETVDALSSTTRVTFIPQPYFFDATTAWAGALQDMVAGADVSASLGSLAERMRRRA